MANLIGPLLGAVGLGALVSFLLRFSVPSFLWILLGVAVVFVLIWAFIRGIRILGWIAAGVLLFALGAGLTTVLLGR